ncbi:unnamed protein product [Plutella xylostella]|uniref:Phosphotransferase n=1 Tax=Plutella xylostella TaxID=51655 RepID=A0A8S4FXI0_PLUXY|nr:unnamed protein product [Plutella xylostella]
MGVVINNLPKIREECEVLQMSDKQIKEIMSRCTRTSRRDCARTHTTRPPSSAGSHTSRTFQWQRRDQLQGAHNQPWENHFDMQSKIYAFQQYYDWHRDSPVRHIAECLANFMKEHNVYNERLALGFTFSFPLRQLGLTKGILQRWTKGFSCSGVVGEDVVSRIERRYCQTRGRSD